MEQSFKKSLQGYQSFREVYAKGDQSLMQKLANEGQRPQVMIVACCDSRVDPGLILQCEPGDLFVVRNVANIIPPYEKDEAHHGTSAALEYGICFLNVKHLILLGHSQCGGIQMLLNSNNANQNDFITNWVSLIKHEGNISESDEYAQQALHLSYQNCLTFPWIKEKMDKKELSIHLWFCDVKKGQILSCSDIHSACQPLE